MSKVKITEQDVGRTFRTKNNSLYRVARIATDKDYPVQCVLHDDYIDYLEDDNIVALTTKGDFYLAEGSKSYLDFKEWADEDEKMGSKIKLKVGQKVKFRNGGTGTVISYGTGVLRNQPFKVHHNERGVNFWYTVNGEWSEIKSESPFDIIEILEEAEGEKMAENLKEKYERLINRRFKNEDGDVVTITSVDVENDSVLIKFNDDEQEYSSTLKDIDEMLENAEEVTGQQEEADFWDDDEVAEEQDKYELRLTVVDANRGATTNKSYYDSLADIGSYVFSNTRGIIDLDQTGTDRSTLLFLLKEKGDVAKITRQINILSANVATVIIRVTQLKD